MDAIKVLLVEDNPGDARLVKEYLAGARNVSFAVDWEQTLEAGLAALARNKYDALLLDLALPDSQRSATFVRVQNAAPALPVVVLTGLDDEVAAVTTVRRGAQDYLVKGKLDTDTLVRTVRYAIARKLGGDRRFTTEDLTFYDGREGRPAYVAFRGKVYDVSASRLWKQGKHNLHLAARDLTEEMAGAPHGEEIVGRVPVVGELVLKETAGRTFLRRLEDLHPHPTAVHFSLAYALPMPFLFVLFLTTGQRMFDLIVFYMLLFGLAAALFSMATGFLAWVLSYESKTTVLFNRKIALSILLFVVVLGTFIWRVTGPQVVRAPPPAYVYLGLLVVQAFLAWVLDHYGKKIVYA